MKKLLILSSRSYPALGGVESVVELLCNSLSSRYSITLFTNFYRTKTPGIKSVPEYLGQNIINHLMALVGIGYKRGNYVVKETYFIFWGISFIRNILSFILAPFFVLHYLFQLLIVRPQIVNLHFADNVAFYGIITKLILPGVKLVTSIHGADIMFFTQRSRLHSFLIKQLVNLSNRVVFVSKFLRDEYIRNIDDALNIGKSVIIYNSINDEMFIPERRKLKTTGTILFAGRLVHKKGVDILIEAYSHLRKKLGERTPNLVIAGGGVEEGKLKELASEVDGISFIGTYTQTQLKSLMEVAIIFVTPSREEPFGIVNIEAMANHVPVVASRVGGIPEYIEDGVTGLLFKSENVGELLNKLVDLIQNYEMRKSISNNAYIYAKTNLTANIQSANYEEVFEGIK